MTVGLGQIRNRDQTLTWWVSIGLWLLVGGCGLVGNSGSGDDDEEIVEEAPAVRSSSQIADSQTAFSLGRLPELAKILESTYGGSSVALIQIKSSSLQFAVTGDLNTLLKEQREALSTKYWTFVQEKGQAFREGVEKCRIVETLGQSLTTYFKTNRPFCALRLFEAQDLLKRVSGDELPRGEFLKSASGEVTRVIELANMPENFDLFGAQQIVVNLKPLKTGAFETDVFLCSKEKKNLGRLQVRVDLNQKTYAIRHDLNVTGDRGLANSVLKSSGLISASWKVPGAEIVVDKDKPRTFQWHMTWDDGVSKKNTHLGEFTPLGDSLVLKGIDYKTESPFVRERRFGASYQIKDFGSQDIGLGEGEIKASYLFTDAQSADLKHGVQAAFTVDPDIEFGFKSLATGLKALASLDLEKDGFISQKRSDLTLEGLGDEKCALTPKSVYRTALSPLQKDQLVSICGFEYHQLAALCEYIEYDEGEVLRALKASPKGI